LSGAARPCLAQARRAPQRPDTARAIRPIGMRRFWAWLTRRIFFAKSLYVALSMKYIANYAIKNNKILLYNFFAVTVSFYRIDTKKYSPNASISLTDNK
jgi:hypothetical protein